jgi:CMP-N-acetylneuraminic acid synthetase
MKVWGLVPARGGSRSIPRKNLVLVAGRPLLDYGTLAAQDSHRLSRIFCSTDDDAIAARARELGLEIAHRPPELSGDEAKVDAVAQAFLRGFAEPELPDAVVLIQPTSPFLLPRHVGELIDALEAHPDAFSAHNVAPVVHNLHAWNQRTIDEAGRVRFLFPDERRAARNKQDKPRLFAFGNLIVARTAALLRGDGFYAEPSVAVVIDHPYDFDLDTPADLKIAEALLGCGAVLLPHVRP